MNEFERTKICRASGKDFTISLDDFAAYARISPVINGHRYSLPPPTLCPDERQRRRLAFRNERKLYASTCAVSSKPMISCYSPDKMLKVCQRELWLDLDNTLFGQEYDFNKNFFEQFNGVSKECYKANVAHDGEMENSAFTHFCGWLKNGYLSFDVGASEDIMYSVWLVWCKDCIDCLYCSRCELCYECVKAENCYTVHYSTQVKNCGFSAFLYNCIGCQQCIGCTNLRNKQFYVFNKPVTEEEYRRLWEELFCGSYATIQNAAIRFAELLRTTPRRANSNVNVTDSNGDHLTDCQSVSDSFNCSNAKDCRFIYDSHHLNDCYDIGTFGQNMEFCYELTGSGGLTGKTGLSNCYFSSYAFYGGHNLLYCLNCHNNCKDLFGCSDLRGKQYCILNRQYSKDDYYEILPKIVTHMQNTNEWGEFFPLSLSPFGYNESLAQEDYPLSKSDALTLGANWSDYQPPPPKVSLAITEADLPDSISDSVPEILNQAIVCRETGRPFKIVAAELDFYVMHKLPLPRVHPEVRHISRKASLNPRQMVTRVCAKTGEQIQTSFAAEFQGEVYAEAAFDKEIV